TPFVPEPYQALGDRVVVNDDVFFWDELPGSVMVVGAGVIGLELGQALARLGVKTTIINRSERVGGLTDPEVRSSAAAAFQSELALYLNASIKSTRREGDQVEVSYQTEDGAEHKTSVDYLLVAAGRRPNVQALDLHNTSAVLNDKSMPEYNPATLQVGNSPIFIAGHVNGVLPLLHEAADDGQFAPENAVAYPEVAPAERRAPVAVGFSDRRLAQAGSRFKDVPSQAVAIGDVDFSRQGRSRVMLKKRGQVRVYGSVRDGRFLGAEKAGPAMEHNAHLLDWAVQKE